jgi:hypothetical protein
MDEFKLRFYLFGLWDKGQHMRGRECYEHEDNKKWKEAIQEELYSVIKKKKHVLWKLVELPRDRKAIGCKWILKENFKVMVVLENTRARLVGVYTWAINRRICYLHMRM